MKLNEYALVEGWDEIMELADGPKVRDWVRALDRAEHLFRVTLMTKTNADTIREALIDTKDEFNELQTFLEAREVYREIKKGEHDEVLDQETVKDLLGVYFQALVDLQHPDSQAPRHKVAWGWWILALGLLVVVLFATGIGGRLIGLLGPVLTLAGVAVLGLVGLAMLVLATFLYLDFKRRKKYRSKDL
jgi:hypothetical protein